MGAMKTTREIIERIGRDRFKAMLGVGEKSLSRAEALNRFTASWYGPICGELDEIGELPPDLDLFTFKARATTDDRGKR